MNSRDRNTWTTGNTPHRPRPFGERHRPHGFPCCRQTPSLPVAISHAGWWRGECGRSPFAATWGCHDPACGTGARITAAVASRYKPAPVRQCRFYSGLRPALPRPTSKACGDPWVAAPSSVQRGKSANHCLPMAGRRSEFLTPTNQPRLLGAPMRGPPPGISFLPGRTRRPSRSEFGNCRAGSLNDKRARGYGSSLLRGASSPQDR